MNRIYQGKVTSAEINHGSFKAPEWEVLERYVWESTLWEHHCIFQDAINYYLVALAALADRQSAKGRFVSDLQARIEAAWEGFPRKTSVGAIGLRRSLASWLSLPEGVASEVAYDIILRGNEASAEIRTLALELLLEKCGGEAAIQQGGRGYFPRFCDSSASPTWDFSDASMKSTSGKEKLGKVLHGDFTQQELDALANELDLSWTVKLQPGKFFTPEESKDRLKEAISHLGGMLEASDNSRIKALVDDYPELGAQLNELNDKVDSIPFEQPIARNRKASKDLTFATIVFKYFPSESTARLLSLFVKKPTEGNPGSGGPDFAAFGDDPIKLARGTRGYVFPAFTALPAWKPSSPGEPKWKEFDIAAFKEALKSLNQFNQKTHERQEAEADLRGRLAILLGGRIEGWKPRKTETGEEVLFPDALDTSRFGLARKLEIVLTEDLAESEVGETQTEHFGECGFEWRDGEWQISRAALRGFRDICEGWIKLYQTHRGTPSTDALEAVVKDYQADGKNSRSIGSVPLFLHLCEERYWPLWLDHEDDGESAASNGFLYKMAEFHETFRNFRRSLEPINLTPAEPIHSRRLYLFSDIKDKLAKVAFETGVDASALQCGVACKSKSGEVDERRIRLHYSARRLLRDELQGGEEMRWLQPMTRALGLSIPEPEKPQSFESAVSLMPDFPRSHHGRKVEKPRFLLNFPVTLDPTWIHDGLGHANVWKGQFNGVRDKLLHLHWPKTITEKAREAAWWNDSRIIENGFTTISVDLGQRTAGAYALLKISCWDPRDKGGTKRPVREIGFDGERTWFAEVLTTGILRLPGEDKKDPLKRDAAGRRATEAHGKAGRNALESEWEEAAKLAAALLADNAESWVGKSATDKSFPQQNDALIALANRRLSRLNTFHRWSCFDPDRPEVVHRREQLIEKLRKELSHWTDAGVVQWKSFVDAGDFTKFREAAGDGFSNLQKGLRQQLLALANRTAPLRDRSWVWLDASSQSGVYGELVDSGPQLTEEKTWIRGQRGLSLARIEQLENLRRLFLRYNRSFDRKPQERAKFGREDTGRDSGEPCRLLLGKIDRMKEQRVNQTAHLIVAEALGLRLSEHQISKDERKRRDLHGEYERIPGREPVDFIVIENLDRYLTSQGRAPSENSRLMKWAHRAVRDKIKMLAEEPFSIPVVETAAAYSSRFSAKTGAPGSRCEERSGLDDRLANVLAKRAEAPERAGQARSSVYAKLREQFATLAVINKYRVEAGKKPRSLLLPKVGGPLFLSLDSENPWQADINAAMNLGFRAVAAPDALHLLHKIRTERNAKDRDLIQPVLKNAREKAAFSDKLPIDLAAEPSVKLVKSQSPNFFYNFNHTVELDMGELKTDSGTVAVASGVGTWATVNVEIASRIAEINERRLLDWKGDPNNPLQEDL